jgi:hypothetical protein
MEDISTLVKNMIDLRERRPQTVEKQRDLNMLIRGYIGDELRGQEPNETRKKELKDEIQKQQIDDGLKALLKLHVDKNGLSFIGVGGSRKKRKSKRRKYRKTR